MLKDTWRMPIDESFGISGISMKNGSIIVRPIAADELFSRVEGRAGSVSCGGSSMRQAQLQMCG